MPRVRFLRINTKDFLSRIQNKTGFTFQELKVHRRSFSDWKYGKCLMPLSVLRKLSKISDFKSPAIKILPDYWYTVIGARKGGMVTYKKYGCIPGWTREASRRGGLESIKSHTKRGTGFFTFKTIFLPKYSSRLAEFFGIILGDGGIADGQVIITWNKKNDKKYIFLFVV